ncbi:conserved hypothetical protein [Stenotrophomonas maltophilia K279a]|uniref:Uncharacterized protein n=1 Tax=Stenotrophomonas maltophilia (strain K279a) TaxID=522373 RepID=B2FTY3_STRMK|nr:conserved hypothetical protein [Stenotrophomonas maltophilia K279a]
MHHRAARTWRQLGGDSATAVRDPAGRPQAGAYRAPVAGVHPRRHPAADPALPHRCSQHPRPTQWPLPQRHRAAVCRSAGGRTHAVERGASRARPGDGATAVDRSWRGAAPVAAIAAGRSLQRSAAGPGLAGTDLVPAGPRQPAAAAGTEPGRTDPRPHRRRTGPRLAIARCGRTVRVERRDTAPPSCRRGHQPAPAAHRGTAGAWHAAALHDGPAVEDRGSARGLPVCGEFQQALRRAVRTGSHRHLRGFGRACSPAPAQCNGNGNGQSQSQSQSGIPWDGGAVWVGRTRRKPIHGGSMAPSMAPTVLPTHTAPPLTDLRDCW